HAREIAPRLEHHALHSRLGERVADERAGDSGADDDGVVDHGKGSSPRRRGNVVLVIWCAAITRPREGTFREGRGHSIQRVLSAPARLRGEDSRHQSGTAASKLPCMCSIHIVIRARLGRPRLRSSSAIGWAPSWSWAPPRWNPTPSPPELNAVLCATPS